MDYYSVLELNKNASPEEIKKKYREKAFKYHPDRNPNNKDECEKKFKEISEAYSVLNDPEKRKQYDRFGKVSNSASQQSWSPFGESFSNGFFRDFDDMFSDFFGVSSSSTHRRVRINPLEIKVEITLKESVIGGSKKITYSRNKICSKCNGSGGESQVCSQCQGSGRINARHGFMTVSMTCNKCSGEGQTLINKCSYCLGKGHEIENQTIEIRIPGGVETGNYIKINGAGSEYRNNEYSDLICIFDVLEDKYFSRKGNNIYCLVHVPMTTACLGGEIEVPTIYNEKVILKIKPGTQYGQKLKIKGKGVLNGDQIVKIIIDIPTSLSNKAKKLLKELEKEN